MKQTIYICNILLSIASNLLSKYFTFLFSPQQKKKMFLSWEEHKYYSPSIHFSFLQLICTSNLHKDFYLRTQKISKEKFEIHTQILQYIIYSLSIFQRKGENQQSPLEVNYSIRKNIKKVII